VVPDGVQAPSYKEPMIVVAILRLLVPRWCRTGGLQLRGLRSECGGRRSVWLGQKGGEGFDV